MYDQSDGRRADPKWLLCSEKFSENPTNFYDRSNPQGWLDRIRDHITGRTPQVDQFLTWAEKHKTEITKDDILNCGECLDQPHLRVSEQLWAMLAALVKSDDETAMIFRNVERHNGAEGWRRIVEPIVEGAELRERFYQPKVLNPEPAKKIEDLNRAI